MGGVMSSVPRQFHKDDLKTPVPSDIDIAQAVEAVKITKIADYLGLKDDEYEQYGSQKAKVRWRFPVRTQYVSVLLV